MKQREIKFRAWDKNKNEMIEISGLNDPFSVICGFYDKWIIQQFTGLKDKNGKEIYEGDCFEVILGDINVMLGNEGKSTKVIGNVEMFNGRWVVKFKNEVKEIIYKDLYNFIKNEKEIIGNIFEKVLPKYEN